jgi:hypothetical protein
MGRGRRGGGLGFAERTQEAQDTMCIQYMLATHWGRVVEGVDE